MGLKTKAPDQENNIEIQNRWKKVNEFLHKGTREGSVQGVIDVRLVAPGLSQCRGRGWGSNCQQLLKYAFIPFSLQTSDSLVVCDRDLRWMMFTQLYCLRYQLVGLNALRSSLHSSPCKKSKAVATLKERNDWFFVIVIFIFTTLPPNIIRQILGQRWCYRFSREAPLVWMVVLK